jgi:hypothetical protein
MGYDMLPWDTMQHKAKLLDQACDERWRLVLGHEPDEALVMLELDEARNWYRLRAARTPLV